MIEQDMIIFRLVMPYDKVLKDKDAFYDKNVDEVYASARYLALRELNKHGFKVLQFIVTKDSYITGEWVLVERNKQNKKEK